MADVLHVIDTATSADRLSALRALRRDGEAVCCIGPAPPHAPADTIPLHRPLGLASLAGRRLAPHVPHGGWVHLWSLPPLPAARYAAARRGARLIWSPDALPRGQERKQLPWLLAEADLYMTVPTDGARRRLMDAGCDESALFVLPPATPQPDDRAGSRRLLRERLGLDEQTLLLVVPAEQARPCGGEWAAWAFAICHHADTPVQLLYARGGPNQRHVRYMAESTGLINAIGFPDNRFSPSDALAAGDIALLPTRCDGWWQPLAEAMASGLPVATSNFPTTAELTGAGQAAVLTTPDAPADLAAGVFSLLEDPARRSGLAHSAQELASQQFRPKTVRPMLDEIYANPR